MRITADTNLLVRVVVRDDPTQARIALDILTRADAVVISLPCLCEVVWVLDSVYSYSRADIALAVRMLMEPANVTVDEMAAAAGLRVLDAGGDFADGIIAAAGMLLGGEVFVSFDRAAVSRVSQVGMLAQNAAILG